jgi:hypothetical protein
VKVDCSQVEVSPQTVEIVKMLEEPENSISQQVLVTYQSHENVDFGQKLPSVLIKTQSAIFSLDVVSGFEI